jgi:hypothetical protein
MDRDGDVVPVTGMRCSGWASKNFWGAVPRFYGPGPEAIETDDAAMSHDRPIADPDDALRVFVRLPGLIIPNPRPNGPSVDNRVCYARQSA